MPTILTPQGWVKVAESPTKRRTVAVDPADALKGPLEYFSCRRSPPKAFPGVLHLPAGATGGRKHSSSREAFPYDLNASPEKLRAQGRGNHISSQVEKVKIGGKNRTVSAPVPQMHVKENDPYYSEAEEQHRSRHRHSPPPSPSAIRSSRHHESKHSKHHHDKHRSHRHHDDMSSASSGSTCSSSSSSSYRSHRSHERTRPIQAAPQPPIIMYTTAPPAPAPSGPRYYNYDSSPRHAHQPPPSTGSARSMSYNWYNATTPLNL